MKTRLWVWLVALCIAGSAAMSTLAQEPKKPETPGAKKPPETPAPGKEATKPTEGGGMDAMMAEMMKYATPDEHHARLKPLAGNWDVAGTFIMDPMDPNAPLEQTKSTCKREWVLNGRYLLQRVEGQPMMGSPEPFAGVGMIGYDRYKAKYVFSWTDTMGTGMMYALGDSDPAGKTFSYTWEDDCPGMGRMKLRHVIKIVDDNKHEMEFYNTGPDGKESKTGTLVFTRKSS